MLTKVFDKIENKSELQPEDLRLLLEAANPREHEIVMRYGLQTKEEFIGRKVSLRGLIELSNICSKNCYYCGIRKDNRHVGRYRLTADEVVASAQWALEQRFGSIVLQGGEIESPGFTDFIEDILHRIREMDGGRLGITLSLGEQSPETYARWFKAGAHRYLLRIESSNPKLYAQLHPANHSWEHRVDCLRALRNCGYQVGTGVMCGLPGQTTEDLVRDILFFRDFDVDMIGMGPYVPHGDTPLGKGIVMSSEEKYERLALGLRMIAVTRIFLQDVNIASATALQALRDDGRELGLLAGANVIMPNMTSAAYRESYKLYDNKPGIYSDCGETWSQIEQRLQEIGETILYDEWGDSRHFYARTAHD